MYQVSWPLMSNRAENWAAHALEPPIRYAAREAGGEDRSLRRPQGGNS
jgi:hypothetical protein